MIKYLIFFYQDGGQPDIMRPVPIYETEFLDMTNCIGRQELITREEMNTWDVLAFWGQNQVCGYHSNKLHLYCCSFSDNDDRMSLSV